MNGIFQIQPQYAHRESWASLADAFGLGYEILELSLTPALNESTLFREIRDYYAGSGRVTSVHGAFIDVNPVSGDAELRALSRRRCEESCEAALFMGAKNVIFHSSCLSFIRGSYLDAWAGRSAEYFMDLAERYAGLSLFIENSQDVDPEPIRALMDRADHPRIGVCLDAGHANYSRAPLKQWFDLLGDRIGYIHLSDNQGLFDDHEPLGTGTTDWAALDRFVRRAGRKMYFTFETGDAEGVRASLAYIREHGLFI